MKLIRKDILRIDHPAFEIIDEFEKAILGNGIVKTANSFNQYLFLPLYYTEKYLKKKNLSIINKFGDLFVKRSSLKKEIYFTVLMGMDFNKYYPYAFFNKKRRYIYLFDVWPKNQHLFIDFIKRFRIDKIFASSSQACNDLNKKFGKNIAYWIPEGIDMSKYKNIPFEDKDIDIINFGRRYELYHEMILPYTHKSGKIYLYEKVKGEIVFKSNDEFVDGLARSKISICVPSNITNPERAGNLETMTNRYLQSMASKSLIVGIAPKEMIDLFGYNSIIEIDMTDPVGQIDHILNNYSTYIPLIEKNFEQVKRFHT